jgi:transcriptional regulator with XRE-family HTH domain
LIGRFLYNAACERRPFHQSRREGRNEMAASFGAELRALREKRGITGSSLSLALCKGRTWACQIECGSANPPCRADLHRVLEVLGAADQMQRFERLAKLSRGTRVILKLAPRMDLDIKETMLLLGAAHKAGRIDATMARGIRRALEKHTAA